MLRPEIDINLYPNKRLDVQYSDISSTCKFDVFYPDSNGKWPCIISIHGGAFKKGDKRNGEMIEPMLNLLSKGFAVIGVNYRLSPEATFPAAIVDIKNALTYIKKHAEELMIDPSKVVVWGGSAGAYLSVMAGLLNKLPFIDGDDDLSVKGIVAWFPPINFCTMDEQLKESGLYNFKHNHSNSTSPESLFMGFCIEDQPLKVAIANPETYLDQGLCPMFIQHGRTDHIVPFQQSLSFYEKSKALGNNIIYEIIEDADHGDPKFELKENIEKVFAFIVDCINA